MAVSLYEASVERFLQNLEGAAGVLKKGREHFTAAGTDLNEIAQHRFWEDMQPLSFQVVSVAHHSIGAIEGVKSGQFGPPPRDLRSYDDLETIVSDASARLSAFKPGEIDALADQPLVFKAGPREMRFTGAGFLLSFSLPNFYFHAATAYDILRSKGVPLGKRDYMGKPRFAA
ncbi:MAG: DUF1993 domain-containing protein [Alphaproteobacteria bacterium]